MAITIASLGRPGELAALLDRLKLQTKSPSVVVLSVTTPADLPPDLKEGPEILFGSAGSCVQRNRAIEHVLDQCDVVAFLDDDYLPSVRMIEGICRFFEAYPQILAANGRLIADGITCGGITPEAAVDMLELHDSDENIDLTFAPSTHGLYGCNMVFRSSAIRSLRFDENLPLYGWQEDIDFSVRVGLAGPIVRTSAFAGVHCGVSRARSPGVRLGYSQIANPIYLVRKGTMSMSFALNLMIKNVLANAAKQFAPEPWIDRAGRLKGNLKALRDFARGALEPSRVLYL